MATKKTTRTSKPSKVIKKVVKKAPREIKWKEEIKGKYTLIIYMNNEVFATKTDDVYASLRNFTPTKITNKVIITLKEGDKYAERVLRVFPARRTFSQPIATEFVAKNLILRLK